jgi:hypothetical protein
VWLSIGISRGLFVNAVMNFRDPHNAGKLWSSCTTGVFSSSAQLHKLAYLIKA